jgi:glycosyltransferase involved in cell wall biosynthesis
MRISLGILAWNEERTLARTLASLFEQTLLADPDPEVASVDVHLVANGCTDGTASVARALFQRPLPERVTGHVHEVPQPGKSNAWNVLVHELADPAADYLVIMDADIWFLDRGCLSTLVRALRDRPEAHVAVDLPIKDVALSPTPSLLDRLSAARSKLWLNGPVVLSGHLYCGRGEVLRGIWMPIGMVLEDHFLRQMIVTDRLTTEEREDRLVRAEGASHVFEAYRTLPSVLAHERQLAVGSVVGAALYAYLREANTDPGPLIRDRNRRDPGWLAELVRERVARRGFWVMPSPLSLRRFSRLRGLPLPGLLANAPVALAAALLDVGVFVSANGVLRDGDSAFRWKKSQSAS